MVLSRVVAGVGSAGIELLVVIIMNGKSSSFNCWTRADCEDLVQLYELPLWISATVFSGTVGLMLGGPIGAVLTDHFGFRP